MKKNFSILSLAAALFLVSCKKDNGNILPPPPAPEQKKMIATTFDEHWDFSYNADKSIKEMSILYSGTDYRQLFTYTPGKVGYQTFSAGKKSLDGSFTLSSGKPVSFKWSYLDDQGMPVSYYEETYQYNAKGLLHRTNWSGGGYEEYVYDANDNLIQVTDYNSVGEAGQRTEYTYGTQKDLYPQFGYLNSRTGSFLFPSFSKNLPVGKKTFNGSSNIIVSEGTLTYELDADGYVVKGNWNKISGPYGSFEWTNSFQ